VVAASFLLGSGAAIPVAEAQRPIAAVDSVVDRIVAVVGTTAILASHIEERILQEFPQGKGLPPTPEGQRELRQDLLKLLVNEELLVQEASRDTTIKILEDDVTKSVDVLLKTTRARFSTEAEYRKDIRVAGFETPDEYRSWLTEQQRRVLTIRELMGKQRAGGKLKSVSPTEREMRAYFDKHKASLPKRSESLSFRQIAVAPSAHAEATTRALTLADSILRELRKGADFTAAAKRFSMDPTTKDLSGELGWVRRGQGLDQRFEDAAFSLRPGVVSDPVESVYGFHLIQVQRTQPAEVQIRHILIMPSIGTADADSAQKIAAAVHQALEQGGSFDSLQRVWHDKSEEREIPPIAVDKLPQAYALALEGVLTGKITAVFRLDAPNDLLRSKYVIAMVTERAAAGEVPYEEVKEQIRGVLSDELTQQRYIDKLRRGTLVEFRAK
jgi:peptidyl-prolyl cis-trans isomerase SurA